MKLSTFYFKIFIVLDVLALLGNVVVIKKFSEFEFFRKTKVEFERKK